MKLSKELFAQLESAKRIHEKSAFAAETAISALQVICKHKWEIQPMHGHGSDIEICVICGIDVTETRNEIPK